MDIIAAYQAVGSYRGAAGLCGTTHKTVQRVVARWRQEGVVEGRRPPPRNTDGIAGLIAQRVAATDGRISAKRLLPSAQAAGYTGSARNFRRAVAQAKIDWRRRRRIYRPWVPVPGQHLAYDWTVEGGYHAFCAVLCWSKIRFVRFAEDERRSTTLRLLDECFEELGGVPAVALTDRMACLRANTVANVVVPHPDYVRFATHYGFRPDFCEAEDPESKGVVEALAGYAQTDLIIPAGGWPDLATANAAAKEWCAEVNARVHSETMAVPLQRLEIERPLLRPLPSMRLSLEPATVRKVDKLSTVRFGSARYSVPAQLRGCRVTVTVQDGEVVLALAGVEVARHGLVAPGEVALLDAHYGPTAARPVRAVRPRTSAELRFMSLGSSAERFLRAAAAAGTSRLPAELEALAGLEAAWGREALVQALERAVTFRRFRAADVRAILQAGKGLPMPTPPGERLTLELPQVPTRPLSAYALEALQ
jgi:hypothetical protein